MWAELFLSNRENILQELSSYIENLKQYQAAIEAKDEETLIRLLDEGRRKKEEVDG
jgi:prephenate dehydrogenase